MSSQRKAIALLITVFFIMAITVSIGIGLKYVNTASSEVKNEDFLFQTGVVVNDVLRLLKNSKILDGIIQEATTESLFLFLSNNKTVLLQSNDYKISLEFGSARGRFNLNTLTDGNKVINVKEVSALKEYLDRYMINNVYVDILLDNMSGIKEDSSYNSAIFNDNPYLFRDYIASNEHLYMINDFFIKNYHDNSLKNVDLEDLFYFSSNRSTLIDLNYATTEVWEMILGVDRQRAEQLSSGGGSYVDLKSLVLNENEERALSRFKVSYFEPYLEVNLKISQNDKSANIRFEYDIKNKKGSNFRYEI